MSSFNFSVPHSAADDHFMFDESYVLCSKDDNFYLLNINTINNEIEHVFTD